MSDSHRYSKGGILIAVKLGLDRRRSNSNDIGWQSPTQTHHDTATIISTYNERINADWAGKSGAIVEKETSRAITMAATGAR